MKGMKNWILKFMWSLKEDKKELTMFQKRLMYFIVTDGIRDSYKEK